MVIPVSTDRLSYATPLQSRREGTVAGGTRGAATDKPQLISGQEYELSENRAATSGETDLAPTVSNATTTGLDLVRDNAHRQNGYLAAVK